MSYTPEMLACLAKDIHNLYKDDPEMLEFATGLVAEGIHRLKKVHTGMISENAVISGNYCKEHYWGRKASAKLIMDQIAKGKSFKRIVAIIKSRQRVHFTTSYENRKLVKYSHLFWREAYKQAGIKLERYIKRSQKYFYKIDGVVYNSKKDAAKVYKIDLKDVQYRCGSSSPKWKDWKFVEASYE